MHNLHRNEIFENIKRKNKGKVEKNTTIAENFKMDSVLEEIQKGNLKWYGYQIRMNNKGKTKQVSEAQPERRKWGRPSKE